jgi:N-acetylglucosamine-6-phosphate deacetylase
LLALTASALLTPLDRIEPGLLLIDDDVIVEVTSLRARSLPANCRHLDFAGAVLVPGFVDIHIHGGGGHDVMEAGADALPAVEQLIARHGVTSYCPTTVTSKVDDLLAALDRLAYAIEGSASGNPAQTGNLRALPVGIHLEGPFISHARRGVHPPDDILRPTLPLFERFWQASRGHIRMMTIAPEIDGALEIITEAVRRGVCVSLGHSDADLSAARSARSAGARHATHTFNAMRPLNHRDPGVLGLVLTDSGITADIIADGVHLHPTIVELFVRLKGPERAVLITDAISATGMPDGRYRLGSLEVEVRDGRCTSQGKLAGSVLTMDRAVSNLMKFAMLDLQPALRTATINPAELLRMQGKRGILAPGAEADIAVLNSRNEVIGTVIHGRAS